MTDTFVPLVSAPAGAAVGQPTGLVRLKPISAKTSAFEPAMPAPALTPSAPESHASAKPPVTAPVPAPASAPVHAPACEPKITLERQGETITHIRVQCGCGQVTEIKCEY